MPRKQRFKPTRKPTVTNESAAGRAEETPDRPTGDDQVTSQHSEPRPDEERRSE